MIISPTPPDELAPSDLASAALSRAVGALLSRQRGDGSWQDGPEAGVRAIAQFVLLRHVIGEGTPAATSALARAIRDRQQRDGGWAESAFGNADHAATILAYIALRLHGDPSDAYYMALAAGWIRDGGGLESADLATTIWLALCGVVPWERVAALPPGIVYLPGWEPRTVSIPLAVLGSLRHVGQSLPFELTELAAAGLAQRAAPPTEPAVGLEHALRSWQRAAAASRAMRAGQGAARRRCADWILAHQDSEGSWDKAIVPTALSLVALTQLGHGRSDPAVVRGLAWLDQVVSLSGRPGGTRQGGLAAVQEASDPVGGPGPGARLARECALGDTELAVAALTEAGVPAEHPALGSARTFLDQAAVGRVGRIVRPGQFAPMRSTGHADERLALLPRGRVLPPDDAGSALEAAESAAWLALAGLAATKPARHRVVWLLRGQRTDGSWPGCREWSDAAVTAAVLLALVAAGVRPAKHPVRSGIRWLVERQACDGQWVGRSSSYCGSIVTTATAVRALLEAGGTDDIVCAERGIRWLATQQPVAASEAEGHAANEDQAAACAADRSEGSEGTRPHHVWSGTQDPRLIRYTSSICYPIFAFSAYLVRIT